MPMTRKLVVAVFATFALASPALAQTEGKLYVGAHIGLAMFHDSDFSSPAGTSSGSWKSGLGIGAAAGYKYSSNIRFEAEFGYKKNKLDTVGGATISGVDLAIMSFMANAYYDVTGLNIPVTPFLGVGLGLAHGSVTAPAGFGGNQSDSEFGYQVIVGVSYAFNKNVSASAGYRYQGSSDLESNAGGVKSKVTYGSSNILAGLNYVF